MDDDDAIFAQRAMELKVRRLPVPFGKILPGDPTASNALRNAA